MTITPSYVGEPECNGVIERVETLAEAQRIIGEFIARYNAEWLIANGSVIRRRRALGPPGSTRVAAERARAWRHP